MRVTNKKVLPCDVCIEAKQSRSIKSSADSATHAPTDEVGAVLCIDQKVHLKPRNWQGNEHVLHIEDHASNYGDVFAMKTKDQWLPLLNQFITQFERQHALTVKIIRGDG